MSRSGRFAIATLSLGSCEIHTLEDKLLAASRAGFRSCELFVADFERYVTCYLNEDGLQPSITSRQKAATALRRLSDSYGVRFNCLQPLRDVEGIRNADEKRKKIEEVEQYLPICAILNIDLILCCSSIRPDSDGSLQIISRDLVNLADLCSRYQQQHGGKLIRIGYEGLSWGSHVNKWSQAWECVNHEPRANLGLIIDSFNMLAREYADPFAPNGLQRSPAVSAQYLRGRLQQLVATVPGDKIYLYQCADAGMPPKPLSRPPSPTSGVPRLQPWSRNCRLFPLEKEMGAYLPVTAVTQAVLATGYAGDISLEVFNASLSELGPNVPAEHAARAYSALQRLDKALDEHVSDTDPHDRPLTPRSCHSPKVDLLPLPQATTAT